MIPFAVIDSSVLVALVTVILGGGILGAITAFKKAGPEVESISVTTLKGVIEELRNELTRLSNENVHLRVSVEKLEGVARENVELRERIERLEAGSF